MTLNDILKAMREGIADSRHADALAVIIHDMRDAATANAGDISLCRKLLGLTDGELVAPAVAELVKASAVLEAYL